jgi:hypothetical protein
MHIPETAGELLAALDTPEPAQLRLRLLGFDHETLCDLIEVEAGGERGTLQASAAGFLAALTPLPWGVTLGELRPLVGQLLDGRPEKWQRRQP